MDSTRRHPARDPLGGESHWLDAAQTDALIDLFELRMKLVGEESRSVATAIPFFVKILTTLLMECDPELHERAPLEFDARVYAQLQIVLQRIDARPKSTP